MNEMSSDNLPKPPGGKLQDGKPQAGFSPREIVSELRTPGLTRGRTI